MYPFSFEMLSLLSCLIKKRGKIGKLEKKKGIMTPFLLGRVRGYLVLILPGGNRKGTFTDMSSG